MPSSHMRDSRQDAMLFAGIRLTHFTRMSFFAFLAMLLLTGACIAQVSNVIAARATLVSDPIRLRGGITPLLAHSTRLGPTSTQQQLTLAIGLYPRNEDELHTYLSDLSQPTSVNYRRFLTPTQYDVLFAPSPTSYSTVQQFLHDAGFTISGVYTHRLLLVASGTVGQAEHALHITLYNYRTPNQHVYYANDDEPLLPAALAELVESIIGLNDAVQLTHPPLPPMQQVRQTLPANQFCLGHGMNYLTPDQVASAYNLNSLYASNLRGEGQSIALFELDTFLTQDISAYSACYGQSHAVIQTIKVGPDPVPSDGGVAEVELDTELILSAAPHLGRLRIYEAANNDAAVLAEWAQIVQDAIPVVSTSWGQCELFMSSAMAQEENTLFSAAALQGQSIFAASGDTGSASCLAQNSNTPQLSADDPAAQPYVTGVGGTTLSLGTNGSYGDETSWNNPPNSATGYAGGASGGGISIFWAAPSWQEGPGVNSPVSSATPCHTTLPQICREIPDVSLHSDPNVGYLLYCSSLAVGCDPNGAWYSVGGTSAAAPLWAAMASLTNELSLRQAGTLLGFVNPLLYQISTQASQYAACFHDITTGNNDFAHLHDGLYAATPGYDMATGLGSYNAYALATMLVSMTHQAHTVPPMPTSTSWYFAEGSVGGGFQEYLTLQNPSALQGASVNVTYLFEKQAAITINHFVPQSARVTVNVNLDLHVAPTAQQLVIAAIVNVAHSGPGIVAERPMYFTYKGVQSGTDVVGATTPSTSFYFPYADTRQQNHSYASFLTMLNPSSTQSATATVTYYTGSCDNTNQPPCPTQQITIAPLHRATTSPTSLNLNQQLAIQVQSNLPIVVERPMYFKDTIATAGGLTTGATSVIGTSTPTSDWLFAEGYTGSNFQEYLILANFSAHVSNATITLEYDNGHTQTLIVNVPAFGQTFFDVNHAYLVPSGICDTTPCQPTPNVAAEVSTSLPIIVERLLYFHYGAARYSGATEAIGEPGPVTHTIYAFAEGYTANTFQEYLTLQNPTANDETIAITLFADTYVMEEQVIVQAHSRRTLNINPLIVPIAQAYTNIGSNSYAVSLIVQAEGDGTQIVAERPLYFNNRGAQGGTDVIGYSGS